jgi:hypothetical protein
VAVEDVSRANAPATVLAKTAVQVDGQVPIPFSLTIDAADVDDRATLSVRARLRSSVGMWISNTHNPVLTRGLVTLSTSWYGACETAEPSLIRRAMARWPVIAGLARPLKADIDGFKALVLLGFRIPLVRTLVSPREGDLVGEWRKQSARI